LTVSGPPLHPPEPEPASRRSFDPPVADRDPGWRINPVRVGPHRSVVSAIVVFVCSVAFIALAIVKPWEANQPIVATASGSIAPGPSTVVSPSPHATGPAGPVTPAELVAAAGPRDAWGLRAVVVPADGLPLGNRFGTGLVERWLRIDVSPGARFSAPLTGTVVQPGDAVMALGVTTPNDAMPLDVRFWRLEPPVAPRRVVAVPVPGPEAGSWLWLPDPTDATSLGSWPSGTYSIDVLLGPTVVRFATSIPPGAPPPARGVPEVGEPPNLISRLQSFVPGPFAVTPHEPIAIAVTAHEGLDERLAWLGAATGRLDIAAVGRVAADPVTGLGVLFAPGETFLAAKLELVGSSGDRPPVDTFRLPPVSRADTQIEMAVLIERSGRTPFDSGLYHLSVVSGLPTGDHLQTWNIEIVPSPPPPTPGTPLVRMTIWIPIMSNPDRLNREPLISDRDLGKPNGDGTCGGSAHIGTSHTMVGLVEPAEISVGRIRLVPLGGPSRSDVPIRYAPNVAAGLTLIAVPSGGLVAGSYQVIVDTTSAAGADSRLYTICVT
jgi:hypothetical protein